MIKAVEARLPGSAETVDETLREGYILAPYFAEQLTIYEKQPRGDAPFFPEMIKGLDVLREDQRLPRSSSTSTPSVRAAKMVEAQRAVSEPSPADKGARGSRPTLYGNKDYDHARRIYLRLLEQSTRNPCTPERTMVWRASLC